MKVFLVVIVIAMSQTGCIALAAILAGGLSKSIKLVGSDVTPFAALPANVVTDKTEISAQHVYGIFPLK